MAKKAQTQTGPRNAGSCAICGTAGGSGRYNGAPYGVAGRLCRADYDRLRGVRRKVEPKPPRGGPPPEPTEAEAARVLAACRGVAAGRFYPSEDRVKRRTRGIPIRVAMTLRRGFLAAGAIDLSAVAVLPGEGEPTAAERTAIATRWATARDVKHAAERARPPRPPRVTRAATPDLNAVWRTRR